VDLKRHYRNIQNECLMKFLDTPLNISVLLGGKRILGVKKSSGVVLIVVLYEVLSGSIRILTCGGFFPVSFPV